MCGPFEKTVNPFFLRLCGIVTTDIVLLLRAEIKLIIYMYRLDSYKNGFFPCIIRFHPVVAPLLPQYSRVAEKEGVGRVVCWGGGVW